MGSEKGCSLLLQGGVPPSTRGVPPSTLLQGGVPPSTKGCSPLLQGVFPLLQRGVPHFYKGVFPLLHGRGKLKFQVDIDIPLIVT